MRVDGKVYRYISIGYFVLHCVHFAVVLVGCLLPFLSDSNLFEVYVKMWPVPYIGLSLLALGCFFAWRSIRGPHNCLAVLFINLLWQPVVELPLVGPYLGVVIAGYFQQPVILNLGIGCRLLTSCDYIIYLDAAFLIYMLVLLFVTPRSKLHK